MADGMTRVVQWTDDTPEVAGHMDGIGDLFRQKLRDGWTFEVPVAGRLTEARASMFARGNCCTIREEIEGSRISSGRAAA